MVHTDIGRTSVARMFENELEDQRTAETVVRNAFPNHIAPRNGVITDIKLTDLTST